MNIRVFLVACFVVLLSAGCATTMESTKESLSEAGSTVKDGFNKLSERFKKTGYTHANLYPDEKRGKIFELCVDESNQIMIDGGLQAVEVVPYGERTTFDVNKANDAEGILSSAGRALVSAALIFTPAAQSVGTFQGSSAGGAVYNSREQARLATKQRFAGAVIQCLQQHDLQIPQ